MDCFERKLDLSVHMATRDMTDRIKQVNGKDKYAICSEFLEWLVLDKEDFEDLDVEWFPHHSGW
tara:strand:- start:48 stop:239 length:192 start_codon:yes stop_codon:yes gene_type:complete